MKTEAGIGVVSTNPRTPGTPRNLKRQEGSSLQASRGPPMLCRLLAPRTVNCSGESSAPGHFYSERNRDVRKDLLLTWETRAISLHSVSNPAAAPQRTLTHREGQARGIPSSHHLLTHRLPLTQLPPTRPPTHLWPRRPVPSMLPNPVVLTASVLEAPQLVRDLPPCSPDSPPISPSV